MTIDVQMTTRGEVAEPMKRLAQEKVAALERYTRRRLLGARVVLTQERNPRIERRARAEAELDLNGRVVRGRVAEPGMETAVDQLVDRLRRQIARVGGERVARRRDVAPVPAGSWRSGDWAPAPEAHTRREGEERELVRRKTFAVEPVSAVEAVAEMEDLDHAFYLFRDVTTGADALVYHRDDGEIGMIVPDDAGATPTPGEPGAPRPEPSRYSDPLALEAALSKMDALGHRFLFFVDAASGRGNVLYQRHDGDCGLIQPAP